MKFSDIEKAISLADERDRIRDHQHCLLKAIDVRCEFLPRGGFSVALSKCPNLREVLAKKLADDLAAIEEELNALGVELDDGGAA